MDDRGFGGLDNAPDMGRDFDQSHDMPAMEYDAQAWEPAEEYEVEQPSKLEPTLDLTPGGALEHEVHTELDEAARKRFSKPSVSTNPRMSLPRSRSLISIPTTLLETLTTHGSTTMTHSRRGGGLRGITSVNRAIATGSVSAVTRCW